MVFHTRVFQASASGCVLGYCVGLAWPTTIPLIFLFLRKERGLRLSSRAKIGCDGGDSKHCVVGATLC